MTAMTTFAIAGITGHTGQATADALLARGHHIRAIVRDAAKAAAWQARGAEVAVADLADPGALAAALRGTGGAFLLVPPNLAAPRYREHQDRVTRSLAAALAESGVPRAVFLSSIGAQRERGTGPIAGIHTAEQLLGRVPGTAVTFLRAGYFYENVAATLGSVVEAGVLPSFFPAALPIAMTSTGDIGRLAAELLTDAPGPTRVVQLGTPRTHDELAAALAKLTGTPVRVHEAPLEAVAPTFVSLGFSPDLAALYAEMIGAIRDGLAFEPGHRTVASTEPLEQVFGALLPR